MSIDEVIDRHHRILSFAPASAIAHTAVLRTSNGKQVSATPVIGWAVMAVIDRQGEIVSTSIYPIVLWEGEAIDPINLLMRRHLSMTVEDVQ